MSRGETRISQNEILRSPEEWSRLRLRLVWIQEKRFPGGETLKVRPKTPFRLWQILAGSAEVSSGEKVFRASAGEFFCLPPGLAENRLFKGARILSLAFDLSDPDLELRLGVPRKMRGPRPKLSAALAGLRRWATRYPDASETLSPSAFGEQQALLLQVVEEILRSQPSAGKSALAAPGVRLQRAFAVLRQHDETSFPPKEKIEIAAGVGGRRLEQLFRKHYNASPREVHTALRLQRAREKLLESDAGLAEIAQELGFSDASTFSQFFSREAKMSPSAFREKQKEY